MLSRYNEAHTELGNLAQELPNSFDVQLQSGLLAIAEGKYQEAEKLLRKIYQAGQKDPRPAVALAQSYTSQQQFEKAIQLLQEDLKKSPDSPTINGLLAFIAGQAREYDLAIKVYKDLLAKEPKSVDLRSRLALVYQTKGDFASALPILEKAQPLAPKDPQSALLLAISLERTGRIEEAKTNYQRVLQLQPENPTALNNLAFLLLGPGGNLDEAVKLAGHALQKTPGQANYADTLGWAYVKKNQPLAALQIFNNLVKTYPDNPTFNYHLGAALLANGEKEKARTALSTALTNKPPKNE
jgi:tetratricopeptide (TPR) repeat protein